MLLFFSTSLKCENYDIEFNAICLILNFDVIGQYPLPLSVCQRNKT